MMRHGLPDRRQCETLEFEHRDDSAAGPLLDLVATKTKEGVPVPKEPVG
jgi:hypothetical protein